MRTDLLIERLVADLVPADRKLIFRKFTVALVAGLAATLAETWLSMGPYRALDGPEQKTLFTQLLLGLGVIGMTSAFLMRAVKPGLDIRGFAAVAVLPVGALLAVLPISIALVNGLISGGSLNDNGSLACLIYIPLFALVPLALMVWALRSGAPTYLARTGAVAGLLAGALSASACASPCSNTALLSLALYHGIALEICAAIGARVGPHALRW